MPQPQRCVLSRRNWRALLTGFIVSLAGSNAFAATTIQSFTPTGVTEPVNQVRVEFSQNMVPASIGSANTNIFNIQCSPAVDGSAEWVSQRVWAFSFRTKSHRNELPGATECSFTLRPGVRDLNRVAVTGRTEFTFKTDGPNIVQIFPSTYWGDVAELEEDQILVLMLDAEVNLASVQQNASFIVQGLASPIGVEIVRDPLITETILNELFRGRRPDSPFVFLRPRQNFPAGAKASLLWDAGIMAQNGIVRVNSAKIDFQVRESLRLTFTCSRENADADCVPMLDMGLRLTGPVSDEQIRSIHLIGPGGKPIYAEPMGDWDDDDRSTTQATFKGPFAPRSEFQLVVPNGIRDLSGRELANRETLPRSVRTGGYPPLAKFAANFGIIESEARPVLLPVTLRNLEAEVTARGLKGTAAGRTLAFKAKDFSQVIAWLRRLDSRDEWSERNVPVLPTAPGRTQQFKIPMRNNGSAFEVVGIPLAEKGFHVVEIESEILGTALLENPGKMFVPASALVTNMAAHVKWGRESSLVWVTRLNDGAVVRGAKVAVRDCQGTAIWNGQTDQNGLARIDANVKSMLRDGLCRDGYSRYNYGAFITAELGDDFTFTHTTWDEGIETYRFTESANLYGDAGPVAGHTIFARSLLRAGERVHMKHMLRVRNSRGFALNPAATLPTTARIRHVGSNTAFTLPLTWDARAGVALSEWAIPTKAPLGTYDVTLMRPNDNEWGGLPSGTFQVEEFQIPTMRGQVALPSEDLVRPTAVQAQVFVSFLNGGPASNLDVKVRHQLSEASLVAFPQYPDFRFANGGVTEGTVRSGERQSQSGSEVISQDVKLDPRGGATVLLGSLGTSEIPRDLSVEMEYPDATGVRRTAQNTIRIWSSQRLVGVKAPRYTTQNKAVDFQVAVTNLKGQPVAGAEVSPGFYQVKSYGHRTKLVGGFYSTEYVTETKKVNATINCARTDAQGLTTCRATPTDSGRFVLAVSTVDQSGTKIMANAAIWVMGDADLEYEVGNNDRIDVIPAKRNYMPGEQAQFEVRMPFAQATALITVEREGVLQSFVRPLSGQNPVFQIPVQAQYAPNVFVSAFVVRGRAAGVAPTALVDLGKPAFKMGLTDINVNWQAYTLNVEVSPNKEVFKPREEAKIRIKVSRPNRMPLNPGTEVALAIVDEGLLQMKGNDSWELLAQMMSRRGLEVETKTAQLQVIGKRHFGMKAYPHGGGGGLQTTRELFETLLDWQPRVRLNERGEALVNVPIRNDSLTEYRIVAVATSGTELFGTGAGKMRTSQDLIVEPALAALARHGDKTNTDVTLRNTTGQSMRVRVGGTVRFRMADNSVRAVSLTERSYELPANQSRSVDLGDIEIPVGAVSASYSLEVASDNGKSTDRLERTQVIVPSINATTQMATLERVTPNLTPIAVERPEGATPGVGGIELVMMRSLTAGLETVRDYFVNYPFKSLEQRLSEVVASGRFDSEEWRRVLADLATQLDDNGFVKYHPSARRGSDILTSYVLSIVHEAGASVGQELEGRMVQALVGYLNGTLRDDSDRFWVDAESTLLRRLNALEALSRYKAADPSLLETLGTVRVQQVPTSGVISYLAVLTRLGLDDDLSKTEIANLLSALQARLTRAGQRLKLTEGPAEAWWTMSSNDTSMARLILLAIEQNTVRQTWPNEVPNLVLGAISMQSRGSWDLTTANAWGTLALRKFSRAFESTPVSGIVRATLENQVKYLDWSKARDGKLAENFTWPEQPGRSLEFNMSQASGEPWALVRTVAAVPLREPRYAGFEMQKTVTPVRQQVAGQWSRGDIAEITLTIQGQTDATQVALFDPIPAGARILGSGLGGQSSLERRPSSSGSWVWPSYDELTFEGYKAFYDWVPASEFKVTYRVQLNHAGEFQLPATRIEAIYDPSLFAETPNTVWKVTKP